ncbi:MAG: EamA family transporter [Ilumatobacter sp.]
MSRETWIVGRTALTPIAWGTTYIVATELLPSGRPMLAACARALPIGLGFLLWSRRLPTGAWWWRATLLGLLNIGAFFALLFVAAFRLPGGVAATAGAIQPLIAAALAAAVLREAFTRRTALAGATGIAGVALLVLDPNASLDAIGVLAALAGAACMATGVVLTKHWGRPVDLITFTGWQLTAGGLALAPVVVLAEGLPSTLTAGNWAGLVWLGVVGTGAAYANWFAGIQRLRVSIVSFLGLLSPLVATIAGWAVLDQSLTGAQLAGAALVLLAIVGPHVHERRKIGFVDGSANAASASSKEWTSAIDVGSNARARSASSGSSMSARV